MLEALTSPALGRKFRHMEQNQDIQAGESTVFWRNSHGGARPGAGRPPGPDKYPRIPAGLKESFQAQFKREMRLYFSDFLTSYKAAIKAGDSKILVDAANRLMGRPVTSVELSGPGGEPIRVKAAAVIALALSDPAQMAALEAFSRLVAPDAGEDDGEDQGEPLAVAGELPEGEPVEVLEVVPQTIIVHEPVEESPQAVEPQADKSLGTDFADWLSET